MKSGEKGRKHVLLLFLPSSHFLRKALGTKRELVDNWLNAQSLLLMLQLDVCRTIGVMTPCCDDDEHDDDDDDDDDDARCLFFCMYLHSYSSF